MRRQRTGKRLALTDRDLEIFRQLSRYRYLRSTYLHAFAGGASETRFKERLGDLFHEGYLDRPEEQWRFADALHAPVVHEAGKGSRLTQGGESSTVTFVGAGAHRQFEHAMMICEVLASIELASCMVDGLRFVAWSEILERVPAPARSAAMPFRMPLSAGGFLIPDGLFGLEYQEGERKSYRFFALEADRGTMPLQRSGVGQTSLSGKIATYQRVLDSRTFKSYWGLPNLLVLIVTQSRERATSIVHADMFKAGAAFLCQAVNPTDLLRPTQSLLREPWERPKSVPLRLDRV